MAKKILIVDDEPDVLKVAMFRLKKAGYEILTALDGQTALSSIRNEKPDLILLDLRLPVLDGPEVCKQVKNNEELKQIPIILFTATTDTTAAVEAEGLEADDYIIKPFEPEELFEKVKNIIG